MVESLCPSNYTEEIMGEVAREPEIEKVPIKDEKVRA